MHAWMWLQGFPARAAALEDAWCTVLGSYVYLLSCLARAADDGAAVLERDDRDADGSLGSLGARAGGGRRREPARVQAIMAPPRPRRRGAARRRPRRRPRLGERGVAQRARHREHRRRRLARLGEELEDERARRRLVPRRERDALALALNGAESSPTQPPAAGEPKYTSRSSRLATRAHARSRVAGSGDANATTGGCNPTRAGRRPATRVLVLRHQHTHRPKRSMATGGGANLTSRPLEWRRTNAPGDVLGKQTSSSRRGKSLKRREQNVLPPIIHGSSWLVVKKTFYFSHTKHPMSPRRGS